MAIFKVKLMVYQPVNVAVYLTGDLGFITRITAASCLVCLQLLQYGMVQPCWSLANCCCTPHTLLLLLLLSLSLCASS